MKKPRMGAGRAITNSDDGDTIIAHSPCPYSIDCRRKWLCHLDREDGAECGVCGNWLPRRVLAQLLAAA